MNYRLFDLDKAFAGGLSRVWIITRNLIFVGIIFLLFRTTTTKFKVVALCTLVAILLHHMISSQYSPTAAIRIISLYSKCMTMFYRLSRLMIQVRHYNLKSNAPKRSHSLWKSDKLSISVSFIS